MADPSTQLDSLARSRGSGTVPKGQPTRGTTIAGPLGASDDTFDTDGARDGMKRPGSKGKSLHDMDSYPGWKPAQPNPHNLRGRM